MSTAEDRVATYCFLAILFGAVAHLAGLTDNAALLAALVAAGVVCYLASRQQRRI